MTGAIVVTRERDVIATTEKVWALAGDLSAWSLWPGHFAFAVGTSLSLPRRVGCMLSVSQHGVSCTVMTAVLDRERRMISWGSGRAEDGSLIITLLVLPRDLGWTSTLQIAVRDNTGGFHSERAAKVHWRRELDLWLGQLKAVAEGTMPWPGTGMPEQMQRACVPPLPAPGFLASSASVHIRAPVEIAWDVAAAPDTARALNPEEVAEAGQVPGTPKVAVGTIEYGLYLPPRERLGIDLSVVTELVPLRSAVNQNVEPPHHETRLTLQPNPDGTRLDIAFRWPSQAIKADPQVQVPTVARRLQLLADRFKALIEQRATGRGRQCDVSPG